MDLLHRYWAEEPWGPWRDNLHAAIIAREIHRAHFKGEIRLDDFMVLDPAKRQQAFDRKSFFDMFKAIAQREPRTDKW
jgi:hypothetical protein